MLLQGHRPLLPRQAAAVGGGLLALSPGLRRRVIPGLAAW